MKHPHRCRDCVYSFKADVFDDGRQVWACDYIEIENKRRPCPYGAGCTVFKPRQSGHREYTSKWFKDKDKP